jgi:hemopexin
VRSHTTVARRREADRFLADLTGYSRQEHDRADLFFEALTGERAGFDAREDFAEDVELVEPFHPPLDAAIVWPNGKAYFFRGDKYVRYSIDPEGADAGYPKKIKDNWSGLWECDIDAAVVWTDRIAYFFKGAEFIKYSIKDPEGAESGYPKKITGAWPGLWDRDIDAALVLDDGAYFFKGDEYIRFPVREPIDKQQGDPPKKIRDKWPQLWERNLDAALAWNNGMAYFFKCARYIGYSIDGRTANAARAIKDYWKGLLGAPSGWRLDRFPPRPGGAANGKVFFENLEKAPAREKTPGVAAWMQRENAMVAQLVAGNMPDALLRWVDVDVSYTPTDGPNKGRTITGTVTVLPDYLAIGDDAEYVYAPLDPWSAQRVASAFGCVLPTARICHAIYSSAAVRKIPAFARDYYRTDSHRVAPRGRDQDSTAAYQEHSDKIRLEMKGATPAIAAGTLVAGHKKDVVLSSHLHPKDCRQVKNCTGVPDESAKIAYHGFYDSAGYPIEPCYHTTSGQLDRSIPKDRPALAHEMQSGSHLFSDYSQGVRLVHPLMTVGGKRMCVAQVLGDPELSYLISFEGPIDPPRIPKPTRPMGPGAGI